MAWLLGGWSLFIVADCGEVVLLPAPRPNFLEDATAISRFLPGFDGLAHMQLLVCEVDRSNSYRDA